MPMRTRKLEAIAESRLNLFETSQSSVTFNHKPTAMVLHNCKFLIVASNLGATAASTASQKRALLAATWNTSLHW